MDFILNGQGHGGVAQLLLAHNMDVNILRPFIGSDGRSYVTRIINGKPTVFATNTPATLRKDEWKIMDEAVMRAAKPRLRAVADLRGAGLQVNLTNGMSKITYEYETMGDISPATISMDGLRQSESDRPEFDIRGLPLPIIHKDFQYPLRQVMVSRNGSTPLDTTTAELASRRVAEEAEKLLIGVTSSYSYAGNTIYGYINHPNRNTHSLTLPTAMGWTPATLLSEVLAMKQKAIDDLHYGPFWLYFSPSWSTVLDNDFSSAKGDITTRARLRMIEDINDVRTLDYLTGYQVILVQAQPDTARMVIGMDITTLQWESHGGMQLNFKVMAIMVPQLRADADNNMGLVHGTAA